MSGVSTVAVDGLVLDRDAQNLLFRDARTANHLSDEPVTDEQIRAIYAILAADTRFHRHWDRLLPFRPGGGAALAEGMARFNATLAAGDFILAVRAAGLAAGPMAGFDNAGVDDEFFADTAVRSLLVVNVGSPGPDAWFDRLPRLEHHEVVTIL